MRHVTRLFRSTWVRIGLAAKLVKAPPERMRWVFSTVAVMMMVTVLVLRLLGQTIVF